MGLFKKKSNSGAEKKDEPVVVAVIENTVLSEIFQDILKKNNIPCICRQQGAGGYIKILTGGLLISDIIYVKESDYEQAKGLYEAFLESNDENEFSNSED